MEREEEEVGEEVEVEGGETLSSKECIEATEPPLLFRTSLLFVLGMYLRPQN